MRDSHEMLFGDQDHCLMPTPIAVGILSLLPEAGLVQEIMKMVHDEPSSALFNGVPSLDETTGERPSHPATPRPPCDHCGAQERYTPMPNSIQLPRQPVTLKPSSGYRTQSSICI